MPVESQLREIFDALGDGLFIAISEGRYIEVNPSGCRMLGYSRDELLQLTPHDIVVPAEVARVSEAMVEMGDLEVRRSEWHFRRKDGSTFVGELVGGQLPDGRFQSIVRDISERLEREQQEQLMRREAAHRTKNVLAIVQAILRQTASGKREGFVETFEERISALSTSHDLFINSAWVGIGLRELVAAQLKPFLAESGDRIAVAGPDVHVSPTAAQTIGLAVHELATNAAKYGALTTPGGRVEISWGISGEDDVARFEMEWRESGGPRVNAPERSGFGTRLIVRTTELALRGKAALNYGEDGVSWTLECPLASLSAG